MRGRRIVLMSIAGIAILFAILFPAIVSTTVDDFVEEVDVHVLEYIESTVCIPTSVSERKTVCSVKVIGDDRNHLYLYVYKADYFYENQNLSRVGVELFPLSLEVAYSDDDIKVLEHYLPAEGGQHGTSMREIFPNKIIKRMSLMTQDDFSQLEATADERAHLIMD